ncbi:sensor histidine kinase [Filimonas effusa]|uniref:histidine kinase n=1 Tax=Filimonas effusa TaxID=2508721 RepID=A0A4Q1DCF8_9BACT|nr:HAMP domain-containing sensor histidine kinase [Filimonas effusa]RXK86525.1 HAMP domain-containing histidine kinase [Filimonas effusa]
MNPWLNWKSVLSLLAIVIVTAVILYSRTLSDKIAGDERKKVDAWVEAQQTIIDTGKANGLSLATKIITENTDIPIIETNENDSITGNHLNLDEDKIAADPNYLQRQLRSFKRLNPPIVFVIKEKPYQANYYYYGPSLLQQQVKYYPFVLLLILSVFLTLTLLMVRTSHKSTQNQLWVGMAKETAHQLGTPVSSLQGWVEMLKEKDDLAPIANEIEKDVIRLQLVSDRFGKIGSTPHLESHDIVVQVAAMVDYIRRRAGNRVVFEMTPLPPIAIFALISPPLFDWVIENLLKNALDAMDGKGTITVHIQQHHQQVWIDISDSGKGIARKNLRKVFLPGFTTKKRGWGLGLPLSRRIATKYHKGDLSIRFSEPGKGTGFRFVLQAGPAGLPELS